MEKFSMVLYDCYMHSRCEEELEDDNDVLGIECTECQKIILQ